MTGTGVMAEKQIRITIIFFLDPTSSRHKGKDAVRIMCAKLPESKTKQ